ncbi:MAG: immunoglobulin-like domain-containing protein [Lachnospiraceae bacterium]
MKNLTNWNGGNGTMAGQKMTYDKAEKLTKNVYTREGYIFKGWSTNADGQVQYKDEVSVKNLSNKANGSVTLYAIGALKMEELNEVPTIHATDKALAVGDTFDPLVGVTAIDKEDGNIPLTKDNIIINDVDMSKAGTYHVTYKVTDKNGASVEKTITVTVKEKDTNKPEAPDNNKPNKPDGQPGTPQTGDATSIGLFGSMFAGSSGVIALLLGKRCKKK